MRVLRLVGVAGLMVGGVVGLASPAVAASGPWSVVAAGAYQTCGINGAKSLYCWGHNALGQLGDGTTTQRSSPTRQGS